MLLVRRLIIWIIELISFLLLTAVFGPHAMGQEHGNAPVAMPVVQLGPAFPTFDPETGERLDLKHSAPVNPVPEPIELPDEENGWAGPQFVEPDWKTIEPRSLEERRRQTPRTFAPDEEAESNAGDDEEQSGPMLEGPQLPFPELNEEQAGCQSCSNSFWIVSSRSAPQRIQDVHSWQQLTYYESVNTQQVVRRTSQDFVQAMQPGVPVCIMVHGSFIEWDIALQDAFYTYQWLAKANGGKPMRMVFYTWPSDGPLTYIPTVDVQRMGRRADHNGVYLSRVIQWMPADSPVSLLGHSHGTRVISSALHLMGGGEIHSKYRCNFRPHGRRIRTVFAAAAVDHYWLNPNNRFGRALFATESLVNLQNRRDAALGVYPWLKPLSGRALARAGFTRIDQRQLGSLNGRIVTMDVTELIQRHHIWPHYYEAPQIAQSLAPYLFYHELTNQQVSETKPTKPPPVAQDSMAHESSSQSQSAIVTPATYSSQGAR